MTCTLCAAAPAVGRALETVMQMRREGTTRVSQRQMLAYLDEHYGVSVHQSTLINHIIRHLRTTW